MINQYWTERPMRRAVVAALLTVTLTSSQLALADVTLNFANADIDQIARAIGDATGQTIVVDPRVKGQLSLQSDRPVTNDQALKTLQAALRMQGYSLLQDHGILKVVPEADAKLQGVPTFVGNRPTARGDQVITQVFQLRNESATNLLPILRPLVSPNNAVAAYPGNNTIVVTDYADNIRRIASIIAGIDTAAGAAIEVVPLSNADATDVATEASKLLDPSAIGSTDASLKVNVSVDSRTNSIILRASNPDRLRMGKLLVKKLDAPTSEPGNIHVVTLQNADATVLAKTLRGMLNQGGGADSSASGSSSKANGNSLYGSNSQSGGGLSNSNGSLPPLPTGTTSSMGSSSSSSGSSLGGNSGQSSKGSASGSSGSDDSGSGVVVADVPSNSLIITAPEPVYRNIRAVIARLDQRRVQVYIEAMIVEVSTTKTGAFGVQWQGGVTSSSGNNILYGNSNFATTSSNGIVNLTTAGIASSSDSSTLATAASALNNGLNIGLLHRFGSILGVGGLLQAVSTNSDVNILSTPNLITLDNQEARILVGQNIPIQQGSYSSASGSTTGVTAYTTYDRTDVGTLLNVRPQVSAGNTIKLQIYQEDSSVDSTTATQNGGYTINKRSIQSTVLADNGEIIVLGGLIGDNYSNANSKIPWLGSLPIIGALFRSENKTRAKTNLMVFLRPVIIRDEQTLQNVSLNRYDYMRAESANYQTDNRVVKDQHLPVPPPVDPNNTPGQMNGIFDWSQRQRDTKAPPLSPNISTQPPYSQDPSVPDANGAYPGNTGSQGPAAPPPAVYVQPRRTESPYLHDPEKP